MFDPTIILVHLFKLFFFTYCVLYFISVHKKAFQLFIICYHKKYLLTYDSYNFIAESLTTIDSKIYLISKFYLNFLNYYFNSKIIFLFFL
jgi:hypothetical protein